MYACSPTGRLIVASWDMVPAKAWIQPESWSHGPKDGGLSYDQAGETEVLWDDQKTVELGGLRVFVDDEGSLWTEDHIELRKEPAP